MLLSITLITTGLVLLNLILLKFSCNKTVKLTKVTKKQLI